MCGIAGYRGQTDPSLLTTMLGLLAHRGPESQGQFDQSLSGIGRCRCLTHGGGDHIDPIDGLDGGIRVALDGELYNGAALRSELEALGHSSSFGVEDDAETVLLSYLQWGTESFQRLNGAWAVAILDLREEPEIVLARDRRGIKPLYVAKTSERTLFASEIKAFLGSANVSGELNNQWLHDYLVTGQADEALTLLSEVRQIPPASWEKISASRSQSDVYVNAKSEGVAEEQPDSPAELWDQSLALATEPKPNVAVYVTPDLGGAALASTISETPAGDKGGQTPKGIAVVYDGNDANASGLKQIESVSGLKLAIVEASSKDWLSDLEAMIWGLDLPTESPEAYSYWLAARSAGPGRLLVDSYGYSEPAGVVEAGDTETRSRPNGVRTRLNNRRGRSGSGRSAETFLSPNLLASHSVDRNNSPALRMDTALRIRDRGSKAHAVEVRLPFLNADLVRLTERLPAGDRERLSWLGERLPNELRSADFGPGSVLPIEKWMRSQRAPIQGILRSPSFAARTWWDAGRLADEFGRFANGDAGYSPVFWRALSVEIWHRMYFAPGDESLGLGRPTKSMFELGDEVAASLVGSPAAKDFLGAGKAHPNRHLFAWSPVDSGTYGRLPIRTKLFEKGDDVVPALLDALVPLPPAAQLIDGDILAISEKAVAIAQGRSYPVAGMKVSPLAKVLSHFVSKTPAGIGLGIPETMELAIREVGAPRIIASAAAGVVGKVVGRRGLFYDVAGPTVRAIDGPTSGTIPPYDTHAKLGPARPHETAEEIAAGLRNKTGAVVSVAIIDANDRGVNVLGLSEGLNGDLIESLFRDNPLGQGSQQTPLALVRRF